MEKDEPPIPILLQIYLGTEKDKPDDITIDNTIIDRNIWEEPNQVLCKHRGNIFKSSAQTMWVV